MGSARDLGVDALRGLALVCIILAHACPPAWLFATRAFDVPLLMLLAGTVLGALATQPLWRRLWGRRTAGRDGRPMGSRTLRSEHRDGAGTQQSSPRAQGFSEHCRAATTEEYASVPEPALTIR